MTVCLFLLRVRIPPTLEPPDAVESLLEFPLVDPVVAVGMPVACRLLAVAAGRGIYYKTSKYVITFPRRGSILYIIQCLYLYEIISYDISFSLLVVFVTKHDLPM